MCYFPFFLFFIFYFDDVTVLEVLKFQVAYVPLVEEGSSYDVVQMSDGFI